MNEPVEFRGCAAPLLWRVEVQRCQCHDALPRRCGELGHLLTLPGRIADAARSCTRWPASATRIMTTARPAATVDHFRTAQTAEPTSAWPGNRLLRRIVIRRDFGVGFRVGVVRTFFGLDIFRLIRRVGIFRLNLLGFLAPRSEQSLLAPLRRRLRLLLRWLAAFWLRQVRPGGAIGWHGHGLGRRRQGFSFRGLCLGLFCQRPHFRGSGWGSRPRLTGTDFVSAASWRTPPLTAHQPENEAARDSIWNSSTACPSVTSLLVAADVIGTRSNLSADSDAVRDTTDVAVGQPYSAPR